MEVIIRVRIRRIIIKDSPRTGFAVCAIRERCDSQTVGLPNAAICRQVVSGRGPQSVSYVNGVTHSQWVCRTLRSADRWSADGVRSRCDTRTV